jgi:translation elongation factor EF-1alpha
MTPKLNALRQTLARAVRTVMKIKIAALLLFAVVPNMGCAKASSDFKMSVEEIRELKGVVLKGIYIAGKIKSGCIANTDKYFVERDGKNILETMARIFEVVEKPGAESAVKGDYVKLYIPDGKVEDVKLGDIVTSSKTSCSK